MKPNPPIRGHELIAEGRQWERYGEDEMHLRDENGRIKMFGGCACGAQPPGWPDVSAAAVKRWHRVHKEDVRSSMLRSSVTRWAGS